jgi:hypothetical protein
LKVNENTFLRRHEISGKRLLRRRISLGKDDPFDDEAQVTSIIPNASKDEEIYKGCNFGKKGRTRPLF